jgi:hypothetical protein
MRRVLACWTVAVPLVLAAASPVDVTLMKRAFANGLNSVQFDPDYATNGKF